MAGSDNPADWLTRGRRPSELHTESNWWKGPDVLYKPLEEWGLKFGVQNQGSLPGEKKLFQSYAAVKAENLICYDSTYPEDVST